MKKVLKTAFCVFTMCALISFVGCGGGDKDGDKGGAKAGEKADGEGSGDKK